MGSSTGLAVQGEAHPVQDDEAPAIEGVARHERFRQVVQAGAVDDHAWFPDGIDQRPAGGIAFDEGLPALGAVHEGLPDIAVHHQAPGGHDLA